MNGLVALYDPYRDAYGLTPEQRALLQTAKDYSGNGNHLTLGADTNASTDDPAYTGTAWSFDGGDFLLGPTTAMWSNTAGMTVLCIANPTRTSNAYIASQYSTSSKRSWQLVGKAFHVQEVATTADADMIATLATGFSEGVVQFGAGRWKPGTAAQIIRGNFVETATAAKVVNDITDASAALVLGSNADKGAFYSGSTLLVAIYTRYLVDAEISRAYHYLKSLMASRGVTVA